MQMLTNENFDSETAQGIVLVDFFTTWCVICKIMRPFLVKAMEELNSINVKVCEIDAELSQETSAKFDISAVPKVILFVGGKAKASFVGIKTKKKIIEFVKNNI